MKKVQPTMDPINARIEVLKKEVADLEARRELLLSGVAGPSHFGDQTLISSLWWDLLRYVVSCLFSFPYVYLLLLSFYPVHFLIFSSTCLISLTWLIHFGFVIYYDTSATTSAMAITYDYDTICFLLILYSLHYFSQVKTYYNTFLWYHP